ncbi:MAG: phosphatidylcholine/phosphatidylserine synthase [Elusimicrobia bacterium]|nr:phosphatidylcholine/phosphatidylserine synthase [Elusimicrobiota bacterium]
MKLKKGIYIPSIFTSMNLAAGFLSIVYSLRGNFTTASWMIMVGWLMDIVDGRLARFTNTQSAFGIEFDSLADMTTFGIAPMVLLWLFYFKNYPLGWVACFIYVLASALRLARYNAKAHEESERAPFFEGLPIPAAAGLWAVFVLLMRIALGYSERKSMVFVIKKMPFFAHILPILMLIVSALMLSRLKYSNFSRFKMTGLIPFRIFIMVVIGIVLIVIYPESSIFLILLIYVLSGIIDLLVRMAKIRAKKAGARNE